MLLIIAVLLAIAWVTGFAVLHVSAAAIHLLLVVAVIVLVMHFLRGRGGPAV